MAEKNNDLKTIFEAQLDQRNVVFEELEDGRYRLITQDGQLTVSLDNLHRQYIRQKDPDVVHRFLNSVFKSLDPLPDYKDAKEGLFPMTESADVDFASEILQMSLSNEVFLSLVYLNEDKEIVRFLDANDTNDWKVTPEELWRMAESNLDKIMEKTKVSFLDVDGFQLGIIEATEPLKASLIRAPSLRQKVEDSLGWPIYAVAPSRDFVYLLSKSDSDQFGRLGRVVVDEYRSTEYPISTEVWEVGDTGIKAIGNFPVE